MQLKNMRMNALSPPYFDFSGVLNMEEKVKEVDDLLLSFIV